MIVCEHEVKPHCLTNCITYLYITGWLGACGLPEVCPDHAVQMCKFASDIVKKTAVLVKKLESELGPDTGDLGIRVGIHSGPVTAGK